MSFPKCIAYCDDGRICGAPAPHADMQRGGFVCAAHYADRDAPRSRRPGEGLKAWQRRIGVERRQAAREAARLERLGRQARRVYDEIDRSPDSDPHDVERPEV